MTRWRELYPPVRAGRARLITAALVVAAVALMLTMPERIGVRPSTAAAPQQPALAMAAIAQLDPVARDALRQKVHDEIAEARRLEQNVAGAFVEVRRPH